MKKVFIVNFSHDGISEFIFTNVKALYDFIMNTSYTPKVIGYDIAGDLKFTYSNLVKELKNKNYDCIITCENGNSIQIIISKILSKY